LKNILSSKRFLGVALGVLCIGILIVCVLINTDRGEAFVPEPTLATTEDSAQWTENSHSSTGTVVRTSETQIITSSTVLSSTTSHITTEVAGDPSSTTRGAAAVTTPSASHETKRSTSANSTSSTRSTQPSGTTGKPATISSSTSTSVVTENKEVEYPVIVSTEGNNVVVQFNDPAPKKDPPPDRPGTPEEHVDHDNVPSKTSDIDRYLEEMPSTSPSSTASEQSTSAVSSSSAVTSDNNTGNREGQVYDPVFGWFPAPSKGSSVIMDNDGDPNKMVGKMGR